MIQANETLKQMHLLYVEDDKDIQKPLSDMFQRKCKTLTVASDGQEGLQAYKEHSPDIIVTDIKMPKLDGLGMISKIRQEDEEIPIVITSAFTETSFLQEAI
ncbi:MAG: response regulator transcription factor, partial [Campylobacterota bacterium]